MTGTDISIHASRGGSDVRRKAHLSADVVFQSTLPAGEATFASRSYPRPQSFQSTLPAGEATPVNTFTVWNLRDFNPRFPRGKRQRIIVTGFIRAFISIHASRGGSDIAMLSIYVTVNDFNPRFPRGKRPPVSAYWLKFTNFNPRFPRGKRRIPHAMDMREFYISIHASRGGSDVFAACTALYFRISIHASRGGSDNGRHHPRHHKSQFQSTLPAGEATYSHCSSGRTWRFQSTLPAGEATIGNGHGFGVLIQFQSTLPAGEATILVRAKEKASPNFNPRFPRGKRPSWVAIVHGVGRISIHASRGGSDRPY